MLILDKMSEKNLNREAFKDLGIYELRQLARQVGVPSPTNKRIGELVAAIQSIYEGRTEPSPRSNRGRRPKSLQNSIVVPKELETILASSKKDEISPLIEGSLQLSCPQFRLKKDGDGNSEIVKGTLMLSSQGHHYLICFHNISLCQVVVYVPTNFIQNFSLRKGDYIKGTITCVSLKNTAVLQELLTINGQPLGEFKRNDFVFEGFFEPEKPLILFGKQVRHGDRINMTMKNIRSGIEQIIDWCDKNTDKRILFLSLDCSPEILGYVQTRKAITPFISIFSDETEKTNRMIEECSAHVNSLLRDGESPILFILDFVSCLYGLDAYYNAGNEGERVFTGHHPNSIKNLRSLIGLGANYGVGSITTVTSMMMGEKETVSDEIRGLFTAEI